VNVIQAGERLCVRCGKTKSIESAFGSHWWCRACCRLASAERRRTEAGRAWAAEYQKRPEVKERAAQSRRKRLATYKVHAKAYRRSPIGKVRHGISQAKRKLRRATSDAQRARVEAVIAAHSRELERLLNLKELS
jgi:hypothetical protein